jgi:hypothetical protein
LDCLAELRDRSGGVLECCGKSKVAGYGIQVSMIHDVRCEICDMREKTAFNPTSQVAYLISLFF